MSEIQYKIYTTVKEVPESWDNLPTQDIFLKTSFLTSLEQSCPINITPYYIGFFKLEKLVGIAVMQRVELYADDVFRKTEDNALIKGTKKIISKIIKGNVLVLGNLMHTGQHGTFFLKEELSFREYLNIVYKALNELKKNIKTKHNKKIRIIAFKDYFEADEMHKNVSFFKTNKLYKVKVQPNMLFDIPDNWNNTDEYISAFTKKYKRRFQTAKKKKGNIQHKELSLKAVGEFQQELFNLYKNVSDNARVNSFVLEPSHFFQLKKELQDKFKIFGYFLEDELIGFYTIILNGKQLETYFLGYNKEFQFKHQIYLNMLFDMAFYAIDNKLRTVVYARTAMEIKSSVGAEAKTMYLYMKHTNAIINLVLKYIVKFMNPKQDWQERHPFKT